MENSATAEVLRPHNVPVEIRNRCPTGNIAGLSLVREAYPLVKRLLVNVVTALIQEPVRSSWLCSADTPCRADD